RVACPWLITRFIDSDAEFLFVPKSKVMEVAEKEGAIPFDTPGAELHHRDEMCTFDVFIKDYELTDKALLRMAKVVNAADTDRLDNDPIAAGLEAIAVGYGLRFPDDTENLAGQLEVYDALYAWCRLQVARK
ncbi:MAG: chromate resistance protein, partial [Desulfobacterales bacterium S7086C20]